MYKECSLKVYLYLPEVNLSSGVLVNYDFKSLRIVELSTWQNFAIFFPLLNEKQLFKFPDLVKSPAPLCSRWTHSAFTLEAAGEIKMDDSQQWNFSVHNPSMWL